MSGCDGSLPPLALAQWPEEAPGSKAERLPQAYLPDVQDVVRLPVHLVRIENQIAVSPIKEAIPLMLHGDQLQVFNSPDLGIEGDTVPQRWESREETATWRELGHA